MWPVSEVLEKFLRVGIVALDLRDFDLPGPGGTSCWSEREGQCCSVCGLVPDADVHCLESTFLF